MHICESNSLNIYYEIINLHERVPYNIVLFLFYGVIKS